MAHGGRARPLARRIRIGPAFRPTLDHLGLTRNAAAQATVGRAVARLANTDELPAPTDVHVRVFLMPEPDREVLAHSRALLALGVWLVYQFDADEVAVLAVTDRPPVPVE